MTVLIIHATNHASLRMRMVSSEQQKLKTPQSPSFECHILKEKITLDNQKTISLLSSDSCVFDMASINEVCKTPAKLEESLLIKHFRRLESPVLKNKITTDTEDVSVAFFIIHNRTSNLQEHFCLLSNLTETGFCCLCRRTPRSITSLA